MNPGDRIIVLNVDDLEAQRYVKTRDLKAGGYDVIEAGTGAEALRLVEQHRPPVVLLDVQLPDINGFEVCAFIKQKWPEVMVLQTSATFTTSGDRVSGLNAGADSYLVQPAEPLELAAADERILVVDDDNDVRDIMTTFLSEIGYIVHEADHGEVALAIQKSVNPQLMIIDFSMPGTNGAEVAKTARLVQPSLPILFVSGYADSAALEAALGSVPLLRKPFLPAELATAVRAALDNSAEPVTTASRDHS